MQYKIEIKLHDHSARRNRENYFFLFSLFTLHAASGYFSVINMVPYSHQFKICRRERNSDAPFDFLLALILLAGKFRATQFAMHMLIFTLCFYTIYNSLKWLMVSVVLLCAYTETTVFHFWFRLILLRF